MNPELQIIWQQLLHDFTSPVILQQLAVVALSLLLAGSLNGLLRAYVMRQAPERWKIGIDAFNRILFPLTSLLLI